jgi:hypothetical protein
VRATCATGAWRSSAACVGWTASRSRRSAITCSNRLVIASGYAARPTRGRALDSLGSTGWLAGDWTKAGWQQKPQDGPPRYEFEYDSEGNLIGAWHAGGRLWAHPTVSDEELRALEERIAKAVAAEVERLIANAHTSAQVYCVGMSYSPGLPENDMLWPEVALGLADDRNQAENVSALWHPQLMAVKLGPAELPPSSALAYDARLLARELEARDARFLHSFFDAIAQTVAASDTLKRLTGTEDMLTVMIDDSEGITRDTVLHHASPRARALLLTSPWLP